MTKWQAHTDAAIQAPERKAYDGKVQVVSDMELATQGDVKAFTRIAEEYSPKLIRFFKLVFFFDVQQARDLTQDVWEKVVRKMHLFDLAKDPWPYIRKIANNTAIDAKRSKKRRGEPYEDLEVTELKARRVSQESDTVGLYTAAHVDLVAALVRLPLSERAALWYHHSDGASIKETAELLGDLLGREVTPAAAKAYVARGKQHLADFLGIQQ